jgi:shikimate dehydrogenase
MCFFSCPFLPFQSSPLSANTLLANIAFHTYRARMHSKFKLAGVMGWPVAHSRSPIIHNHWIREHGLSGAYGHFAVQPHCLGEAIAGLRALGLAGCNITIPHKVHAMQWVDEVHPMAQRVGAINCVVVQDDGRLVGYNHDGYGFIQSLLSAQPHWRADAGAAVVIGAGGACRAILVSLIDAGAREIRLLNRTRSKAEQLAQEFGPAIHVGDWSDKEAALAGAALLVQTTNQGMHGEPPLPLELTELPTSALVADIVYTPLETPLLAQARQRGNATVNGLGMLLHQARPAFASWFGVDPHVTPALEQAVLATFAHQSQA